ncbi:ADP-ribosylglycohydrolase family protein [Nocardiopsis sp. NPDC006139]|uniref:ADP-ribosylglycohydrolase family protein n=1 Tax=Nocardiopsis sp. NPDC006139 TaxID=3154578 RepID=UPI0033A0BB06
MALLRTPTAHQDDRAAGVLLAAACGDALGVPYEFRPRLTRNQTPQMIGGGLGPYAPGEYSDDTQMAVCIAQALVDTQPAAIQDHHVLNEIADNFLTWYTTGATDVGVQTSAVLGSGQDDVATPWSASVLLRESRTRWQLGRPSAGNGSLMRTAPVALYDLHDPEETAEAARLVSDLTHAAPQAGDACVIWCEGIRHAVLHADFQGVRNGVELLPEQRRAWWHTRLDEAEAQDPHTFPNNGYVVSALQAAWSAITRTPVPANNPAKGVFAADHLRLALEAAVRAGHDTDTVAAIAGALLGARWGASAVPWHWQRSVHGWPVITARDLISLGVRISHQNQPDRQGWPLAERHPRNIDARTPYQVAHPHDDGVILGNLPLADLDPADLEVDAVVSLCRVGNSDFAHIRDRDHLQIWLVDRPRANAHGHYTLDQAARAVHGLRQEGKRVLLHCAAGRSRTPTAAARYSGLLGIDPATAMTDVCKALAPNRPWVNFELERFVFDLAGTAQPPVSERVWNTRTTLNPRSAKE